MSLASRARNYWACVSILFNQAVHFGGAPYPLSFSETCYIRRNQRRYAFGMRVVDSIFALFGELDHCEKAWYSGCSERARYIDPTR